MAFNDHISLMDTTVIPAKLIADIKNEDARFPQFTPDGKLLLLTSDTGEEPTCYRDSSSCSSGGYASIIQIIDPETGARLNTFHPYKSDLFQYSVISPDSKLLFTGSFFGGIRVWDLQETKPTMLMELPGWAFALSPKGSVLLTDIDDQLAGIYGIASEGHLPHMYMLSGSIVPSTVNLRAEPNNDAEVIGQAKGRVRIFGRSGNYAYLPDQKGWVRADSQYLRLIGGLMMDAIPEIDPHALATAYSVPLTLSTAATTENTVNTTVSQLLVSLKLPVGNSVIMPSDVTAGLTRIEPDNAAQVSLLGVLPSIEI